MDVMPMDQVSARIIAIATGEFQQMADVEINSKFTSGYERRTY